MLNTKTLLPLIILGAFLLIAAVIRMNPPASGQRLDNRGPLLAVETLEVTPRDHRIVLESYGTIQPRTQTMLVAQVGGQIVSINPNVRDGGFFEAGDVLVSIDDRDYVADVRIAEAALADAQQSLAEASARSNQAEEDWRRLGNTGDAPELVLRIPQLEAARAKVRSAESELSKATLNLERTKITAPFAGRVLRKNVDLGQVVSQNTQLAEVYSTDVVEIRLPLRNRDLSFIDLPETDRYADEVRNSGGRVTIHTDLIGNASWNAKLVRTEGAIDATARQLHVIAQITDPFGTEAEQAPLKIGQYVTARIDGKTIDGALVIPNGVIYQGSYVYIVQDGVLSRRDIDILWQNDEEAVVASGLEVGDQLVTTPLGQVTSGVRVTIDAEQAPQERAQ